MRQALVGQVDAMLGDWRSPQVRWGKSSGQKGNPRTRMGTRWDESRFWRANWATSPSTSASK